MNRQKASLLPLAAGGVGLLISIVIAVLQLLKFEFAVKELSILGWFLTPLCVFVALALDFYQQRRGRSDPEFIVKPTYTRILTMFAYVSLVVAGFHIWVVAEMWSAS